MDAMGYEEFINYMYLDLPVWMPNGSVTGCQFTILEGLTQKTWRFGSNESPLQTYMIFRFHVISMSIFQDVLLYLINLYGKFAGTYTINTVHGSYVFFVKRIVVRISTSLQTNAPPMEECPFRPLVICYPRDSMNYMVYIDQHLDGLGG